MHVFSPLRARLASFEHAYALAIRLRDQTGRQQYVVRTGNPLQPVTIVPEPPPEALCLLAQVL